MSLRNKAILSFFIVLALSLPLGFEYYSSQPGFCGSCHIMKKYYQTWDNSKHRNIACVDCHYAPGEQHTITAKFKGMSQLFSYLASPGSAVRKRAFIDDQSCVTAKCHPMDEKLATKKITYTEDVSYVHKTHFDKTIEGQKLHCATCHTHVSSKEHFKVSKETCFLCHFKNTAFNEGRARCYLCHEISDKPLQKQFEGIKVIGEVKPITHRSLEEAGVSCASCHIDLVRGSGEIKREDCLNCHEEGEATRKFDDKKLMHEKHVAGQEADCANCHESIVHKEVDDILEVVRSQCKYCHPDHHLYQKAILAGDKLEGVQKTPALMTEVRTNCLACHTKKGIDTQGQPVLRGSPEACAACHTKEHAKMLEQWQAAISKELTTAKKTATEAESAINKVKGKISKEKVDEAKDMLTKGKHYLRIIELGHGLHNKKYSIMLIDAAMDNFEDVIDDLNDNE